MATIIDRIIEPTDEHAIMVTMDPGTKVEVRSRFDQSWSAGFEVIEELEDGGVRVRRVSDSAELPIVFEADEVRPERRRKRSMWWY